MKRFIRILKLAKNYRGLAGLNILFNVLTVIFSIFSLVMIIPFLELLFDIQKPVHEQPVYPGLTIALKDYVIQSFNYKITGIIESQGKVRALIFICMLVVGVFFLKNLFRYLALYVMAPLRNGVVRDLRQSLYSKTMALPLAYFSEKRKGDIMSRMTTDVQDIEWSILSVLETLFKEPIAVFISLFWMIMISPTLTLFVFVLLPLTGLIIGRIGKTLKKESLKGQENLGMLSAMIEETLGGLRIIKAFSGMKYQEKRFNEQNDRLFGIMTGVFRRRDLASPISEFLGICVVVIVLWFGGKLVLNPDAALNAQTFILFIMIFALNLIPPSKAFTTAYYNVQKGIASFDRVQEILTAENSIKESDNPISIESFGKSIEFKGVTFAYETETVLDGVDLTVPKGKMIALVGPSGAGKSTLVDMLPRFYDPQNGGIEVDGVDIREYKLADLRGLMGVVTQESILFNDTVFNNIAYAKETATLEEVQEAARIANAHEFIEQMEDGYDTIIGDRGGKLSGGERQRLSIARAVLKNPPILILDEATSSLDSESEKLVQDALFKLMKNRTSLVIAHRLSTIQFADEIIVMQDGKIQERGNHIGLMAKDGIYKKLVDLQAF
jgi:subfamily B ATP-binding cassette protein MsbA